MDKKDCGDETIFDRKNTELSALRNELSILERKMDKICLYMEKMSITEYVELLYNPRKLLWPNFFSGLLRGFGMALGFTLLAALVMYLLNILNFLNIPIIGKFIADIVEIVQAHLKY
ncbi:MAG: DUF5665 domain-containing protein [Syntrophomonadaceae bacterium]|nr:DUF5665 domain-containing protein [Syntrophomonadaceae bacterium]